MKEYKIFLISAQSKPWNNIWYYKAGLEANGHEVITVAPQNEGTSVEELFELTKSRRPDFMIHTKKEFPAEIFQQLREITKVIQWYPDPVCPGWLPPYIAAADVFVTMSQGLVEPFKKYNPKVYYLSQGFEPSFFKIKEISEADRRRFESEVTFIGNLGSKTHYLDRRQYLERVIREGFYLKWWGPRLPRKLSTLPLLFGGLGRSYGGKFVWGEEYAKAVKLSKIFLAFDALPHIKTSMSARMYTAVGCGAFYICHHVEGIEEVMEPDKEIVTFCSEDEMIDKIKYYLKNDVLRNKIAQAGQDRVMREHNYAVRTQQLLRIIEDALQ